jgi:tetratricopeptide (TPR) repeat protein
VAQAPSASDEVRALDQAMTLLRREHDGARALAALDAYLARFPRGLLNREARFARVDALLLLGRPDQALAALEVLPLDRGRRSTELQVIRAELRARNSCTSAAADFDAALSQSPNAALLERIFYGRGVCRSKLGDLAGAADDLHRYVERFPNGVHARSAREWIESTESRPSHKGAP